MMVTRTFLEPQGDLSPAVVADALGLAGIELPVSVVRTWTPIELLVAYDWAIREHLNAGDNRCVRRRPCPSFVRLPQGLMLMARALDQTFANILHAVGNLLAIPPKADP